MTPLLKTGMKKSIVTIAGLFLAFTALHAQNTDAAAVKQMVESKNYVFHAQQAIPQTGTTRILDASYDFTVAGDSVNSYLPYFGRAYVAPIDPTEGGIKFATREFAYQQTIGKKSWQITILPKDQADVRQLNLQIFDNGNASLQVLFTSRSPISFQGYITAGNAGTKKGF